MAISVPPASLTAAELARRASRARTYDRNLVAQRQRAAQGRQDYIRYRSGTSRTARIRAAASLRAWKMSEANAKGTATARTAYRANEYTPFRTAYDRLGTLSKGTPDLDALLGKLTPFDPAAAAERLGAQGQYNQRLVAIKQARDRLAQEYGTARRQVETEQPNRLRALLSNFAGRGLAHSSGYADAFGREQAGYTDALSRLDTANQQGLAQASLEEGGAKSDWLAQLAASLSNTTGRLAGSAGQLGIAGNQDLPLLLEIARRRLAAGG